MFLGNTFLSSFLRVAPTPASTDNEGVECLLEEGELAWLLASVLSVCKRDVPALASGSVGDEELLLLLDALGEGRG